MIYPGVNRLDYDASVEGGVFPAHIESCNSPKVARWLEKVLHLIPIESRPEGYNPLIQRNLDPKWIVRLGNPARIVTTPSSRWMPSRSARHSI